MDLNLGEITAMSERSSLAQTIIFPTDLILPENIKSSCSLSPVT
jgi:hypothetical protein